MTILPASESILEILFCGCVKSCDNNRCACRENGIPCTDIYKLKNCVNSVTIEESDDDDDDDDDEQDNDSEISDDSDEDEI